MNSRISKITPTAFLILFIMFLSLLIGCTSINNNNIYSKDCEMDTECIISKLNEGSSCCTSCSAEAVNTKTQEMRLNLLDKCSEKDKNKCPIYDCGYRDNEKAVCRNSKCVLVPITDPKECKNDYCIIEVARSNKDPSTCELMILHNKFKISVYQHIV